MTYVSHDADDGAWQYLGDRMVEGGGPVLVCLQHPVERDPSLKELADLPVGWCAERAAPSEPWSRLKMPTMIPCESPPAASSVAHPMSENPDIGQAMRRLPVWRRFSHGSN